MQEVEGAELAKLKDSRGEEVAALQARGKEEQAHLDKVRDLPFHIRY